MTWLFLAAAATSAVLLWSWCAAASQADDVLEAEHARRERAT